MIDYEKLKEAHELAKHAKIDLVTTVRTFEDGDCRLSAAITGGQHTNDMDGIISELKELTKPEPKYKIKQYVWLINDEDKPEQIYIIDIDACSDEMYKDEYGNWWLEEQLYPSCQALIDAQIEYWTSLKSEETSTCSDDMSMSSISGCDEIKCEHETGTIAAGMLAKNLVCVKCGEFIYKDKIVGHTECEH